MSDIDYLSIIQAVGNAIPDPIFIIDTEGRYKAVIGGEERSLYSSGNPLIGKTMHEILPKEKADLFLETIRKAVATKSLQLVEYALAPEQVKGLEVDGPPISQWFEARIYPLAGHGESAVIWFVINITKRKKYEEELIQLSITDPLTGLHNRRHFNSLLTKEFERSKRYNTELAVIVADLDYFKRINDSYGHASGDETLICFASILEKNLRGIDFSARYGGEEFIAALPHTDLESAIEISERIRSRLSSTQIKTKSGTINATVSIGIAQLNKNDTQIDDLIIRADNALYEAKSAGRNCVRSL
jgi:diguanylate cyclase (GGDEF)-like protein